MKREDPPKGPMDRPLEEWGRFFFGPDWDRMSDEEQRNITDLANEFFLDLAMFGDADDDGLPDYPEGGLDLGDDEGFDLL